MHKSKLRQIVIAACIALLPLATQAAGLGRLNVISGLGEPLNAEIELLSVTPEELSSITAVIASDEAYATQGIERTSMHGSIKIEPGKKVDGTPILKLTTVQEVSDPFLDMLIQVDWSTGRLLREYTLLLDPPGYSATTTDSNPPTAMPSSPVVEPMPEMTEKPSAEGKKDKKAVKKSKAVKVMEPEAVPGSPSTDELETKRGDTLTAIAMRMGVEGVSLDQMLVGLYRANKDAFVGDNMNRLKVGQIIRAPSAEELQAISHQEAFNDVHVQTADWNAYRNKLAGIVAEAPATSENVSNQSSGGKLTAAAEDKAVPASSGSHDVVKLSKSDSGGGNTNKADTKAMQDKLMAMQEEGIAREKSVKDANERIVALEKQIEDMQKLITIKSQAMAGLQKNATTATAPSTALVATAPTANLATPANPAIPVKSAATPVTPATTPPQIDTKITATKGPDPITAVSTPEVKPSTSPEVTSNAKTNESKPAKKKKKVLITPPPPAPIEETPIIPGGLLTGVGGALALLGGIWLFFRNKRKRGLNRVEQGISASGGLKANTVFGNTSDDKADSSDASFLTNFSQSSGEMIDTHEVDAIAEAEVYMAYGREAQAEEILKDAIKKDPARYELHLKLLEIFAARNDSSAFEAISGELYSTLGTSDPVWAKVAEMGHKIEPDNPLYDVSSIPAVVTTDAPTVAESSQKLDVSDFDDAEVMTEPSLDFSLDADTVDLAANSTVPITEEATAELKVPESDLTSAAPAINMSADVDSAVHMEVAEFSETLPGLDMPEIGVEVSAPTIDMPQEIAFEAAPEEAKPKQDAGLDFNFDLSAAEDTPAMQVTEEAESKVEDGLDFNFDLSAAEDTPAMQTHEASVNQSDTDKNEFDLSGISLDLGSEPTVAKQGVADKGAEIAPIEGESEDVNTKLDLVTAYLDMGDKEGARELLDEVLKEGGVQQRERAQQMLSGLA